MLSIHESPARSYDSTCPLCAEEFSDLVQPHLDAMRRAARRVLGSPDLAEDAVQEVLLRVWSRGWLPDEPGRALVWLAERGARSMARGQRRRCVHEREACERCEDSFPDPLAHLEGRELESELRAGMESLHDHHRQVLELLEVEGTDYAGLARRLGVPVGTVRSRLSRARRALRRELEQRGLEPAGAAGIDGSVGTLPPPAA